MKNLRIVSINVTHSCEAKELRYRTDAEWICAIQNCCDWDRPIYVTPHPDDSYLRRHFVAQTLDAEGYIIPGDYETETPELGKVRYSIWTERSDYYKSVFPPTNLKPTFWDKWGEVIKAFGYALLICVLCCIADIFLSRIGFDDRIYIFAVSYLVAMSFFKNQTIKRLKQKK